MPDYTQLNLYNQFITFIGMKLHTKNQLYIVFEILKFYLGMPEHA